MITKPFAALVLALVLSPMAMAQTSAVAGATVETAPPDAAHTSPAQPKSPRPGDRNCIQSTGSLIPAKPGTCLPVAGRSYSQQDIRNTGSPTLGPALQQLDPSVTVSGGH